MGRPDVDKMLSEISASQLVEWEAALDVLGIDDGWQQTGVVCREIHRVANATSGGTSEPPKADVFNPHLVTFKQIGDAPTRKTLTVEQMHKEAAREAGL